MAYSITVKVEDNLCSADKFTIVEQTCKSGTYWHTTASGDSRTLKMESSGQSGLLRFRNERGDAFVVALGVHNYKRWCDIIPDFPADSTAMHVHMQYYTSGTPNSKMLWEQKDMLAKTEKHNTNIIQIAYLKSEGHDLEATIYIDNAHECMKHD